MEDAEKHIERADPARGWRWELRSYLGGCAALGPACEGRLSFTPGMVLWCHDVGHGTVESVELGGGQAAKSRVGATLAFGLAGLATKGY